MKLVKEKELKEDEYGLVNEEGKWEAEESRTTIYRMKRRRK